MLSAVAGAEPVVNAAATAVAVACACAIASPSRSGSAPGEESESDSEAVSWATRTVTGCAQKRQQVLLDSHVAASGAVAEREFERERQWSGSRESTRATRA